MTGSVNARSREQLEKQVQEVGSSWDRVWERMGCLDLLIREARGSVSERGSGRNDPIRGENSKKPSRPEGRDP